MTIPSTQLFLLFIAGSQVLRTGESMEVSPSTHPSSQPTVVFIPPQFGNETAIGAPVPTTYARFGSAVSVFEAVIVVGSVGADSNKGAAYIFNNTGGKAPLSVTHQKVVASNGSAGDYFGGSVSLYGDKFVVGAFGDDEKGADAGAVYVFGSIGSTWSQSQKVVASDGGAGDNFGCSVSLYGGIFAVGAYGDNDKGADAGSVYIFVTTDHGITWLQQHKAVASDGGANDRFGWSVSVYGDIFVVGAYGDDDNGGSAGAAYVFTSDGTESQKVVASNGSAGDYFGGSVSLYRDKFVVGAFGDDEKGADAGAVYVFGSIGSTWSQSQKVVASDGGTGDCFGCSVSLYGGIFAVGAYRDDDKGSDAGAVYLFALKSAVWSESQKIVATSGTADAQFGHAVSLHANVLAVGAHLAYFSVGTVYTYLAPEILTSQPAEPSGEPSGIPSGCPSSRPTAEPTVRPSSIPSRDPSSAPSGSPSSEPSAAPTCRPTCVPASAPSSLPSGQPAGAPSYQPTALPSGDPSSSPSCVPTTGPSSGPSGIPSGFPSTRPTAEPTVDPSGVPSSGPSGIPSGFPSTRPTAEPTVDPSGVPSSGPSGVPSETPSCTPTSVPSALPSVRPSGAPSGLPSRDPSSSPSCVPTTGPSGEPSGIPSGCPSSRPTAKPTVRPSSVPFRDPSSAPSGSPSSEPSAAPTCGPTCGPTSAPRSLPSGRPSDAPSYQPTALPSRDPSSSPSCVPTTGPSGEPSGIPSGCPSSRPTAKPTVRPSSVPSRDPSSAPSGSPSSEPTVDPSGVPSSGPSGIPSGCPSTRPTAEPTVDPSGVPSSGPSGVPSETPSCTPTSVLSALPSVRPSGAPSGLPSRDPSSSPSCVPTTGPSGEPSGIPSGCPSSRPTAKPTVRPSSAPSRDPSSAPSECPTREPSCLPLSGPSSKPSRAPSGEPSATPTSEPSTRPSSAPSHQSTGHPSSEPSTVPTSKPSGAPSGCPSTNPSSCSSRVPTLDPSGSPSSVPSGKPYGVPSGEPSAMPTAEPSTRPSGAPSHQSTGHPSCEPTTVPTSKPSGAPSGCPSTNPSSCSSRVPTLDPSGSPSSVPSGKPYGVPSGEPSAMPTAEPSTRPSGAPSHQSTGHPSCEPTAVPSSEPSGAPSGCPSSRPRARPTDVSSGSPLSVPNGKPSGVPSSEPSAMPTAEPSAPPSNAPSHQPTEHPSCEPSAVPTSEPSGTPPGCPSSRPNARPTVDLSCSPSSGPTRKRSSVPSSEPSSFVITGSAAPSFAPAPSPSRVPTRRPTVTGATQAPSLSALQAWVEKASAEVLLLFASRREIYFDVTVSQSVVVGGCQMYSVFSDARVLDAMLLLRPITISILHQTSLEHEVAPAESVHCSDVSVIRNMVRQLSSSFLSAYSCGGRNWTLGECPDGSRVVCVDCANACSAESAVDTYAFSWKPCNSQGKGEPNSRDGARYLVVDFAENAAAPAVVSVEVTVDQNSFNVSVLLDSEGYVSCGVFPSGVTPPSVESITIQNYFAASHVLNARVVVNSLIASTLYDLYCVTQSVTSVSMSYENMLQTKTAVSTACCKYIQVELLGSSVYEFTDTPGFVELILSGPPLLNILLTLNCENIDAPIQCSTVFYPYSVSVGPLSQTQYSMSFLANASGTYDLSLSLSGASAAEYTVVYTNGASVRVVSLATPMPPASVVSAIFVGYGKSLSVKFSHPTDRGKLNGVFSCWEIFQFSAASSSFCQWTDSRTLVVLFDSSSSQVPGSTVSLRGGLIRAACSLSAEKCQSWAAAGEQPFTLTRPLLPALPAVFISTSAVIGMCDDMVFDVSSSFGTGGRKWKSMAISVDSHSSNITLVRLLVSQQSQTSPTRLVIPHRFLESGYTYTWNIRLCNFLDSCAAASTVVGVSNSQVPTVTILGQRLRVIYRNTSFQLSMLAYVTACSGQKTSRDLIYSWSVFETTSTSQSLLSDIASASVDARTFTIPRFRLNIDTTYTFIGSVLNTASGLTATTSASVFVKRGSMAAIIGGGYEQSFRSVDSLLIDGSASYDENFDSSGQSSLKYRWDCIRLLPSFSASTCGLTVNTVGGNASVRVYASDINKATQSQVTLTIVGSDGKTASTSVLINVVVEESSSVKILTTTGVKVNPADKLTILGLLSSRVAGVATWAVNDVSVSLTSHARSAVHVDYSEGELSSPTPINFVLAPGALYSGGRFQFSLVFETLDHRTSMSTVTIFTNSAPSGGILDANPKNGEMVSTLFSFSAENWDDEDIPLSYEFSYGQSDAIAFTSFRSKAELSHCSTLLPRGVQQRNFNLSVRVNVFDYLGAISSVINEVTVNPTHVKLQDINAQFSDALNDTTANSDDQKGLVALLGSVLNAANCSGAPDCTSRNRMGCASVAHTCGECKVEFIGDAGNSNSYCTANNANVTYMNAKCSHDSDCGLSWVCVAGSCVRSSKGCPNDCSGHGQCSFYSTVLANEFPRVCLLGDITCVAKCRCEYQFSGSSCSETSEVLKMKRDFREQLIRKMLNIIESESADGTTIQSWVTLLVSLSQVSDELTLPSKLVLASATRRILEISLIVQPPLEYVVDILQVIDALQWTENENDDAADTLVEESIAAISEALIIYTEIISRSLTRGEVPQESQTDLFSIQTMVATLSDYSDVELSSPLSALSSVNDQRPHSISLMGSEWGIDGYQDFPVSLVSTKATLYNDSNFNSEVVRLKYAQSACVGSALCAISITIQNAVPLKPPNSGTALVPTGGNVSDYITRFWITCQLNVVSNRTRVCPGGETYLMACNGSWAGTYQKTCPLIAASSVCNTLINNIPVNSNCSVESYTSHNTTCRCYLRDFGGALKVDNGSRRLSGTNSTTASVDFVAMLDYTVVEFSETWSSADSLTLTSVGESWRVLVTIAAVSLAAILAATAGHHADIQHNKIEPVEADVPKHISPISADGLLDEALPLVLREKPFVEKFRREIKIYHRWFGVVFTYSSQVPRSVRILSLVSAAIVMLFANAVVYNLGFPNDASCETHDTSSACLEEQSSFSGGSKCIWLESSEECSFREPADDTRMVIFTAIIAAIMSTPVAVFVDYVIMNYIAVKTKTKRDLATQRFNSNGSRKLSRSSVSISKSEDTRRRQHLSSSNSSIEAMRGRKKNLSVVPSGAHPVLNVMNFNGLDRKISNGHRGDDALPTSLQEDMSLLMADIRDFRLTLGVTERRTFDEMWALDTDGTFLSNQSSDRSLLDVISGAMGKAPANIYRAVTMDLWKIRKSLVKEVDAAESVTDQRVIGSRLMFLFQKDLLPGVNAMILESKGQRDFISEKNKVEKYQKALAWAFVMSLNMGLIFFLYLFSLRQTDKRQQAWFRTFIVWLLLEIFVMSTMVVLVVNVLIPMATMRDLAKVKRRLKTTIEDYLSDMRSPSPSSTTSQSGNRDADSSFNVAEYFFVSTRLSKFYPSLPESRIIQKFSTPWPHQSYRRTKSLSAGYRKRFATLGQSLSMVVIFFLKGFLSAPNAVQDMIVNMSSVVFFGYILSFVIRAYTIHPVLGVLPVFALFFVIGLGLYWYVKRCSKKEESCTKVVPERTLDAGATASDPIQHSTSIATRRQSVVQGLSIARELHDQRYGVANSTLQAPLSLTHSPQGNVRDDITDRKPVEPGIHEVPSPIQFESNDSLLASHLMEMYEISDDSDDEFSVRPAGVHQESIDSAVDRDDVMMSFSNGVVASSASLRAGLGGLSAEGYGNLDISNEVIDSAPVSMKYPSNWGEWSSDSEEDELGTTDYVDSCITNLSIGSAIDALGSREIGALRVVPEEEEDHNDV